MKVLESTVFCASAFIKWKNILILPFCSSQLQELQSPVQTIKYFYVNASKLEFLITLHSSSATYLPIKSWPTTRLLLHIDE